MSFLPEYAMLPEVLEANGDGACGSLSAVFELCLREGIVRNLYKGRWGPTVGQNLAALSPVGRKVLEFLKARGRLVSCRNGRPDPPKTSEDWCWEAIASRRHRDLLAIFAERSTADQFAEQPLVVATDDAVERGDLRPTQSVALSFQVADYRQHLAPLIRVAREVCFIDPYIDPHHPHYRTGFLEILKLAIDNPNPLRIEIHRKSEYRPRRGNQPALEYCAEKDWQPIFDDWNRQLRAMKLKADVFIWSKFQSRYFLSNHVGLMAGKGFKSDPGNKEPQHWGRLERADCDGVRRDFNSLGNSLIHERKCQFSIGVS